MQKLAEVKTESFIFNHVRYDNEAERHFAKHSHSMLEFIHVVSGEVAYTVENKKFVAKPGDTIAIMPYAYHYFSLTSKQDYEKIGVLIPTEQAVLEGLSTDPFLLIPPTHVRIHEIFSKLDFYHDNCTENTFFELLQALAKELLINLSLLQKEQPQVEHKQVHPLIEQAINYINSDLFNCNTIKELAQTLCVSEGYLKTLFTQQMKIPPKKYITEKKMLLAKSMIEKGEPPTQVAFQCGYSSYVTFYRLYVKYFHTSPTDTNKKNG